MDRKTMAVFLAVLLAAAIFGLGYTVLSGDEFSFSDPEPGTSTPSAGSNASCSITLKEARLLLISPNGSIVKVTKFSWLAITAQGVEVSRVRVVYRFASDCPGAWVVKLYMNVSGPERQERQFVFTQRKQGSSIYGEFEIPIETYMDLTANRQEGKYIYAFRMVVDTPAGTMTSGLIIKQFELKFPESSGPEPPVIQPPGGSPKYPIVIVVP